MDDDACERTGLVPVEAARAPRLGAKGIRRHRGGGPLPAGARGRRPEPRGGCGGGTGRRAGLENGSDGWGELRFKLWVVVRISMPLSRFAVPPNETISISPARARRMFGSVSRALPRQNGK